MKKRWYVINSQDNTPAMDEEAERWIYFPTKAKAMKMAASMAEDEPHCAFLVCEAADFVVVETKPVIAKPCTK